MSFTFSAVDLVNLLFIVAGIGICLLCFLLITASVHLRRDVRRYFQAFFLLILLYISLHLVRQIMDGRAGDGVRTALYIVTFAEVIAAGFMAHMISLLILYVSDLGKKAMRRLDIVLFILLFLHVALLAVGWPLDLIYYFDAGNEYHRAAWYLLSNLCPVSLMVIDMALLIFRCRKIDRRVRSAFFIYLLAPLTAMVVQSFSYGVQFIIAATVSASVYMFAVILQNQNAKYEKQEKENARIETELTMASAIQADMLPNIFPPFPGRDEFDVFASMNPAKEVGGDFYDFFLIDDDHLCLVMADVSGKGVPAALFMMASKIILANNAMMGKSPAQILTDTNAAICSNNREEMFVTVWLGILEISTGKLTAANAGHEYPALKQPDGSFELVKDKHGFVIGGMDGVRYKEYELMLRPGSELFVYTDGVPEATDAQGQMFGAENMLAALNAQANADPQHILQNVHRSVDAFVKDAPQFDDLTMLCLAYKGKDN